MTSHYSRGLFGLAIGVTLFATSVQAQISRRSPREVGQIINVALDAVVPPEQALSNHTVAERGIRLDYGRTMAAFVQPDNAATRAGLGLARHVTEGTDWLLGDCDQMGSQPCARLASAAYVSVEPISLSSNQASVWVHVRWVTTPSKSTRSFMSGSSTEVILSRSASGSWTFVKTGRRIIS